MGIYKKYSVFTGFAAGFLFLCSIFCLFFLPLTSNRTVWNSYRILFLPISADEGAILRTAYEEEIAGVISLSSSEARFKDFEEIFEDAPFFTERERYIQWFINDQENLQYMYIPSNQKITAGFLSFLKNNTDFFYIEENSNLSMFNFAVALLFFAAALFYTSRKSMYFTAAAPFLLYAAFQKDILAVSAVILMLYTIAFWTEAVGSYLKFTKEQLIKRIKKNSLLVFLPFVSFTISKFGSNTSLLLFSSAFIAGLSLTYMTEKMRFFIGEQPSAEKLHKKITPYVMNPSSIVKFWDREKLFKVSGLAAFLIIVVACFLFFHFSKTIKAYKNILYLPLPDRVAAEAGFSKKAFDFLDEIRSGVDIPDLGNYISDLWKVRSLPYVNLHNPQIDNEKVTVNEFTADESGVMTEREKVLFVFDDEFISDVLSLRPRPSIEDMLCAQGRFMTVSYSRKKFPLNRFNLAALLVAMLSALMPITVIVHRVFEK